MNLFRLLRFWKAPHHADAVLIPSEPDPEDRFYCVGKDGSGNQFMGFVTGAYPGNKYPHKDAAWEQMQRWYSVLHYFDAQGNHVRTLTFCAGTSADNQREVAAQAMGQLDEWLSEMKRPSKRPIRVLPFSHEDGAYVFGLFIENSEDGSGGRWAMLQPNDVMFHEPWDGNYST
jgi:hypothetical protein